MNRRVCVMLPLLYAFSVTAALVVLIISARSGVSTYRRHQNIRAIERALFNYRCAYLALPYDTRGPKYALYRLRELIDPESFDLRGWLSGAGGVKWNHEKQTLEGGDYWYANYPHDVGEKDPCPILIEWPGVIQNTEWLYCVFMWKGEIYVNKVSKEDIIIEATKQIEPFTIQEDTGQKHDGNADRKTK